MLKSYQAVFRSRWRALLWASGVLLTAYCTVPSQDGGEDPVVGLVKSYAGQSPEAPPPEHVNPWALDKPNPN